MTPDEIKALRAELDLTQREWAVRLKVDVSYIGRMERGVIKPSLSMLRKLRRELRRAAKRKPKEA